MTLKKWRKANRYSQSAFAKLLYDATGVFVDSTTINTWENKKVTPRPDTRRAIEKVTGGEVKFAD